MRHVNRNHYDASDPVRSIYGTGLKGLFAACHDPLPVKMEELLRRLEKSDEKGAEE
jgi:hypothetical protein